MTLIGAAEHQILDMHVAIERWFTGVATPDELDPLVARFSADFSMVTTAGALLGKSEVQAMFARSHATRAGLRIAVSSIEVQAAWSDGVLATYQEDHSDASGEHTARLSTVMLVGNASSPHWRHLHETWIAAAASITDGLSR